VAAGRERAQRGFALVAVLWLLVLLAFLASSFSNSTRTGAYLTRNLEMAAQAEALADAAVHRVLWELLQLDPERPLRADGAVYEWTFGDGRVRFSVRDEAGKVDVNLASEELLQRLFVAVGVDQRDAQALAAAVAAFREGGNAAAADPFGEGGEDLPGAESGPFRTVDAVQQVPAMGAAVFARIRPLITVYSMLPEPDLAVASPAVRAAMLDAAAAGAEPDDAFAASARAAPAGGAAPDEGGAAPFSMVGEDRRDDAEEAPDGLALAAETVAIHAEARLPSGAVFAREAIASLAATDDESFRFYVWRQARRQYFPVERRERNF
jgi:general secretion pathway protein K